uniref:Uncharacterized protein n=1 Tax=Strongyloides papillosus TaxID=174720 RepID=A0A0N5BUX1_STREA
MNEDYEEDDEKEQIKDEYVNLGFNIKEEENIRSAVKKLRQPEIAEEETQTEKPEETTTTVAIVSTKSPEISKPSEQEKHDFEVTKQAKEILVQFESRFLAKINNKETINSESNIQESKTQNSNLQKRDIGDSEYITQLGNNPNFFQGDIVLIKDQAEKLIQKASKDAQDNNVCIQGINTVIKCDDEHISLTDMESCKAKKKNN